MKVAACFSIVLVCVAALPVEVAFDTSGELDFSKLIPNNIYVEPVNSTGFRLDELPGARIIGGTEVTPNTVPYQVAVIINSISLCGGSLISTTTVLTAAHCTISASFVQIRLGAHHFNEEEETQVRITSTNVKNHASFNPLTIANDISIILLPSAVSLNDNIQIVPLAPIDAGTYEGSRALLAGWGRISDNSNSPSPVLRAVYLTIISNVACRNFFGSLITNSNICTSGVGNVGACNGDSGSPLVVDGVQVGVTSFGSFLCESQTPSGYARISSFRAWIYDNAGI